MTPIYLYQSEGADTDFWTSDGPTKHDLKCVEFGTLTVYRFEENGIFIISQEGIWEPVQMGCLKEAPPELKELGPYHDLKG